jgi:heptosyltransferase-3
MRPFARLKYLSQSWQLALVRAYLAAQRAAKKARRQGCIPVYVALTEHFGDIVAAEPIIEQIRLRHKDCFLIWIVQPQNACLLTYHPKIEAIVIVDSLNTWIRLRPLISIYKTYDLHVPGKPWPGAKLSIPLAWHAPLITLDSYYNYGSLLHIFCKLADLPPISQTPTVYIDLDTKRAVDGLALPHEYVTIHCRSSMAERDWQTQHWESLISLIGNTYGLPCLEIGLTPTIQRGDSANGPQLCGRLSLLQTAEVIRRSRLFIGIDSGPAHLANASGRPSVILLGKFCKFDRYFPYTGFFENPSQASIIQWPQPVAEIPVQIVWDEINRLMKRLPSNNAKEVKTCPS